MVRSKAEEKAVFIVPSILARVEIYEHFESVRKLSSIPNPAVHVYMYIPSPARFKSYNLASLQFFTNTCRDDSYLIYE